MSEIRQSVSRVIRFGSFDADLQTHELRKYGVRLRLPGQSFQILRMLLEHPGNLITRDELQKALWPSDTFVDFEHGLSAAVNRLREALGDSAEEPRFVETLPRRGYRFIGLVVPPEPVPERHSAPSTGESATAAPESHAVVVSHRQWSKIALLLVVAACILAATFVFLRWHRPASAALTPVPFTALPGQAANPTFSPDGKQIAFEWNGAQDTRSMGFDLYVKTIGSENLHRLTNEPSDAIAPAWSPDGALIAFQRISSGEGGIYVIAAQGGAQRKLRSTNPHFGLSLRISWSPDGKRIAFADAPVSGGHRRLHLLSLDTLESKQIEHNETCLEEGMPAFSHDGKQLAYSCYTTSGDFGMFIATATGAEPRLIKAFPGYVDSPVWTPDDKKFIFLPGWDRLTLRELTLASGSERPLPFHGQGELGSIVTSAKGDQLAYHVMSGGDLNIWRGDLLHPQTKPVKLIGTTRDEACPQYSPDGRHIVFASDRSGYVEIWMSDADGGNVAQLTDLKNPVTGTPSWSPDGRKIVFDSRTPIREDQLHADLYIVDTNERVPRKLVTGTEEASMPSWSHDGKWIYFIGGSRIGGERIYRVSPEGGHAMAVSSARGHFPLESFDGQSVYFEVPPGLLQVASLNPTGTESRVEGMPHLSYFMNWTVVSHGIYFFPEHAPMTLSYYDFATKKVRSLFQVGPMVQFESSVSPDGRYILYSQLDDARSDIMLINNFR